MNPASDISNLRLPRLQERFGLQRLDRDILLTCLLVEIDPRYRRLCGYLQDDCSRAQPTVELVLEILRSLLPPGESGRQAFDPRAPLMAHRLVVLDGEPRGDLALPMRSLRLEDRISAYLLGEDQPDGRLAGFFDLQPPLQLAWPDEAPENAWTPDPAGLRNLVEWWKRQPPGWGAAIFLHGPYGSGRLKTARLLSTLAGLPLYRFDIPQALRSPHDWDTLVLVGLREATLQGAAVIFSGCNSLLNGDESAGKWEMLVEAVDRFPGLAFLSSEITWEPAGHFRGKPYLRLETSQPDFPRRARLWELHLPASLNDPELARELANDFQFTEGQMTDALSTAQAIAAAREPLDPQVSRDDLYEGCRRQSSRQLITFARHLKPLPGLDFDDLVLPPQNKRQLLDLNERITYRGKVYSELGLERRLRLGKGLVVLFVGTSGVGKTRAAEILASKRGVDLYKVDLSAVASKWVGETEKNLNRVFAEAENANAILFFDEADALFGKRGEIKEAQDRWANMEINYLLQRIEEYSGVVILASNLRQNIDEAFVRRIQMLVDFPFPDEAARLAIFQKIFPESVVPPSPTRLQKLASRFRLTGGSIKNVVVDATFRAVAGGSFTEDGKPRVHVRHLVLAIAREYQKLGKPLLQGEFGAEYYECVRQEILMENGRVR